MLGIGRRFALGGGPLRIVLALRPKAGIFVGGKGASPSFGNVAASSAILVSLGCSWVYARVICG